MPVAHWRSNNGDATRQMHAPKEASYKGWWNAARKVFPGLPLWMEARNYLEVDATPETIHFKWDEGDLFIARKRSPR